MTAQNIRGLASLKTSKFEERSLSLILQLSVLLLAPHPKHAPPLRRLTKICATVARA